MTDAKKRWLDTISDAAFDRAMLTAARMNSTCPDCGRQSFKFGRDGVCPFSHTPEPDTAEHA